MCVCINTYPTLSGPASVKKSGETKKTSFTIKNKEENTAQGGNVYELSTFRTSTQRSLSLSLIYEQAQSININCIPPSKGGNFNVSSGPYVETSHSGCSISICMCERMCIETVN